MYAIVVGCGGMGALVAQTLAVDGFDVAVVDRDPEAFKILGSGFDGVTLVGTGIDTDILKQAGADRADALAALTEDDNVNLMVAQLAEKVFHIPRVMARNNEPTKRTVFLKMGIQTVTPKELGALQAKAFLSSGVWTRSILGAGELVLAQIVIDEGLAGHRVADWEIPGKMRPLAVDRDGIMSIPGPDYLLQRDDTVMLVVRRDALSLLSEYHRENSR
jgi:trk system potassium uptake protein TrkA